MSNKNRWVVDNNDVIHKFPYWIAILPHQSNTKECRQYIRQIYKLATEDRLYRLVKKAITGEQPKVLTELTRLDFHPFDRGDGYYDLITDGGLNWRDCEEQSLLSYYDLEGQLVTNWISDFFNFYKKLHPDKYSNPHSRENYWKKQDENSLPIIIEHCEKGYLNHELRGYESIIGEVYEFKLTSDIWFPRVVGWIDSEEQSYDNSELSALNTPRLNHFLQRAKELSLGLGGKWEIRGEKLVVVDEHDKKINYYYFDPIDIRIVDSKIVCIDGVQKEVYPSLSNYMGVENILPECQISENGISLEIDVKPKNYWCMLTNEKSEIDLPEWEAKFPARDFSTCQDFWPLVRTILEVGQQEEIFQIFMEETEFHQFICDVDRGASHS
jgi:hypothetical protein